MSQNGSSKIIFTADLHLTDLPRDSHRWDLFPWLGKQARKHGVETIILGGDITDAKDKHSAQLTNKLVQSLCDLSKDASIWILRGNHDYIDEQEPFFGFVRGFKHINFITKPTVLVLPNDVNVLLLPNTRNWEQEWEGQNFRYPLIFCHQTFEGSESETGFKLPGGIPTSVLAAAGAVYSGDIHKPQMVGKNIEYVGAPYRIRFGDDFTPRVLLIEEDGETKDLKFETKNKVLLEFGIKYVGSANWVNGLNEGDQVKVRIRLQRSQYAEWSAIKKQIIEDASECKLELTGPELVPIPDKPKKPAKGAEKPAGGNLPDQAVAAYAEQKRASSAMAEAGKAYLKQAMKG